VRELRATGVPWASFNGESSQRLLGRGIEGLSRV
jgi:hypothetical protein